MTMSDAVCPSCGKRRGSNADCLSCREAAARELATQARDVTHENLAAHAEDARRFEEDPPWYARFAPPKLKSKLKLLTLIIQDYVRGQYRRVPWSAMITVVAAVAYVLSPFDLIPDFLVPIGW